MYNYVMFLSLAVTHGALEVGGGSGSPTGGYCIIM